MKEFVWYSPELAAWRVDAKEVGRIFKDDFGPFHTMFFQTSNGLQFVDFYLMGPL